MRLLMLGCTGFVGRELVPVLLSAGHELTLISRKSEKLFLQQFTSSKQLSYLQADTTDKKSWQKESILSAISQAEGVINLTGEPIAERRWTQKHCQKLESSRIDTTNSLVNAISELKRPPKVLINASAVGYYGTSPNSCFTESSPSGEDFLAKLCKSWETAALKKPSGTRLLIVRLGIVIGSDGGALGKMLPVFKAGLGGPIGNGKQWMSWIHRTDLCTLIKQALENSAWSGVVNGVAPKPVRMAEFASELGKSLSRPSLLNVPGPILKLLLGDGARVVLEGQNVASNHLSELQFRYKYPELSLALTAATKL